MTSDKMPTGTTGGTPQVLLAHHLKQLKLPTVLREYEKVARECARDGIDHPRYLLRLIELELIDRERRTELQPVVVVVLRDYLLGNREADAAAAARRRRIRPSSDRPDYPAASPGATMPVS